MTTKTARSINKISKRQTIALVPEELSRDLNFGVALASAIVCFDEVKDRCDYGQNGVPRLPVAD